MHAVTSMETSVVEETLGSVTQINAGSSTGGILIRSSARVSRKRLDSLRSPTSERRDSRKDEGSEETEKPEKAPVRKVSWWSNWSAEEKDLFFEALNDYGKDFEAIQRYLIEKLHKADPTENKSVPQIRSFYYKTFGKILPKLVFPDHIPKQAQEFFGLINYGELRKKIKMRTKKDALKLNELVIRGHTVLREKNKWITVKTPRCKALRKLYRKEDIPEGKNRLPGHIKIELLPADNQTWSRVQTLAQNPRVHIIVPLQYRLLSLIQYLEKRWLPRHEKYKADLIEGSEIEAASCEVTERLVLKPKITNGVHVAQFNLNSNISYAKKMCISSYEEMLGKKGASLERLKKLYTDLGIKSKRLKIDQKEKEKELNKAETSGIEAIPVENINKENGVEEIVMEVACGNIDGTLKETVLNSPTSPKNVNFEEEKKHELEVESPKAKNSCEEMCKEGWTIDNCRSLTVGDIFLMVGCDCTLKFSYFWKPLIEPDIKNDNMNRLSSMLSKLVRLARLTRTPCPVMCPCGHQCVEVKRPRNGSFGDDGGGANTKANSASDHTFQRPAVQMKRVLPAAGRLDGETFRAQIFKLTPRYCKRRGRGIAPKSTVVQRTLPLLPKTGNNAALANVKNLPKPVPTVVSDQISEPFQLNHVSAVGVLPEAHKDTVLVDPPPSPTPSLSILFKEFTTSANFTGEDIGPPPSPSPSVILREGWLNEEVTDYSLSSILSHLEAPTKISASDHYGTGPPGDVDTQMQYFMSEPSIDFTAKFADLAAQVSSEAGQ